MKENSLLKLDKMIKLFLNHIEEKKQMAYKPRLNLQQTGFTSYATLFLSIVLFIGVLVIILMIISGT